ncbi:uracil-DNA glycosylase [Elstera cyanobacteriorum]|uniref:Type-5 uracil-DNA glycosylase n=1 Tax=Elstera cyanobacteriorum TaxID=2022747 RepID=A0A255XQB7_9PROT|nr:uracil-DNA glycosylase [Elstera cyanobacteriorum]OYQ18450.1 uracil-DNA glycosylase [Elstera cyanobacteriorum]GFZ80192.1 uracil-DNA glycosylase [Elstera cyanobacteriorum]
MSLPTPAHDCPVCPRLAAFRAANAAAYPSFFNSPVPSWGDIGAGLLIIGLAPGLKGANQTGRPFTGDYAGDTLYGALLRHGFAHGTYGRSPDDGMVLTGCRIANAVRCVPPENKPTPDEINRCRPFLIGELEAQPKTGVILALGTIAHQSLLRSLGIPVARFKFAHGAEHRLADGRVLIDSYHCSRYNTNTGRLTEAMFDAVIARCRALLA